MRDVKENAVWYEHIKTCKQSGARLGIVHTPHGSFETPVFMPVGTQATVKAMSPEEVKGMGADIILSNTYHLWLRPGEEIVEKAGGLHKFMNWDGSILTDSGGFQVFSLSEMRKIEEEGVHFKNHLSGEKLFLSPEKAMHIQNALGSDIMMAFDECPPVHADRRYMEKSIERTGRWLKRCRAALTSGQALFGINQGGLDPELRLKSLKEITELDLPGYAIGGLAVGETNSEMYQILDFIVPKFPENKPRYLMGVGKPANLVEAIERGVDMFDCVMPTRNARHGHIFTTSGSINIKNAKYKADHTPLDSGLSHKFATYSKSYLHHLFKTNERLGERIATTQNLAYLKHLVNEIKTAAKAGKFKEFKAKFYATTNYTNS